MLRHNSVNVLTISHSVAAVCTGVTLFPCSPPDPVYNPALPCQGAASLGYARTPMVASCPDPDAGLNEPEGRCHAFI